MAKVLGIGGVFVKAEDPAKLAQWYKDVLGVDTQSWGGAIFAPPDKGQQVWTAFPSDSDHFAPSTQSFMINLVVDDLDGVLAKAAEAGVTPLKIDDQDEYGRFAWIMDPAGVKLELWEAKAEA
jgi:predicted enzyme related to lactoylglutathione lyase